MILRVLYFLIFYYDFMGNIFCYFYVWVRLPIIQLLSDQQARIFFKRNIVMLRRLQVNKPFVCAYKILRFCANPQKFQTLVPAKNSHFKVVPEAIAVGKQCHNLWTKWVFSKIYKWKHCTEAMNMYLSLNIDMNNIASRVLTDNTLTHTHAIRHLCTYHEVSHFVLCVCINNMYK